MEGFMISEDEIYEALNTYLEEENLELYDLNIVGYPIISKIEAFVYPPNIINLDLTSRLNKQFQRVLENMGIEKGSYDMVVSSPGVERKLKTHRHFEMALGELIKVKTIEPINGIYSHEGVINSVNKETIALQVNDYLLEIKFINIKNAKIEFKQFKEKVKG
jgi:ribosome maturation factor RimP